MLDFGCRSLFSSSFLYIRCPKVLLGLDLVCLDQKWSRPKCHGRDVLIWTGNQYLLDLDKGMSPPTIAIHTLTMICTIILEMENTMRTVLGYLMDKESNPIVASRAKEIYVSRIQPSYYVHGVALDSLGTKASSSPPAAVVWQRAFHPWYWLPPVSMFKHAQCINNVK